MCPGTAEAAGGIGQFVSNLTAELHRIDPGITIKIVDTRGSGHIAASPFFFLSAIGQILVLGLAGRISLIHVNVASYGSTVRKFVICFLASFLRIPTLVHLHGGMFHKFYNSQPRSLQRLIRWMFTGASRVVVLGALWQRFAVEQLGVAPANVEIVVNGVSPGRELDMAGQRGVELVFLGRLSEQKGISDLLNALSSPGVVSQQWYAIIAGDGDSGLYREKARRAGLGDRIEFPGWLDRAAVDRLLAHADILTLPSYVEGLPLAILEAMANRVAIIATPVGSIPEFLVNDESALLVQPGAVDELAYALERLISSAELRARLSHNGHQLFRERFNISAAAQRFSGIYREIGVGLRPEP